jgi:hypothetical protein
MSLGPNFIGQAPSPESGAFGIVAHVTAKSVSDLQEILALFLTIQKKTNSNDEPDCTEVCNSCNRLMKEGELELRTDTFSPLLHTVQNPSST